MEREVTLERKRLPAEEFTKHAPPLVAPRTPQRALGDISNTAHLHAGAVAPASRDDANSWMKGFDADASAVSPARILASSASSAAATARAGGENALGEDEESLTLPPEELGALQALLAKSGAAIASLKADLAEALAARDAAERRAEDAEARCKALAARSEAASDESGDGGCAVQPVDPPLPSRTNWTRLVPRPVLTGHVSSLAPY